MKYITILSNFQLAAKELQLSSVQIFVRLSCNIFSPPLNSHVLAILVNMGQTLVNKMHIENLWDMGFRD